MEMTDEIQIDAARSVVWEALNNPEILKACIPGCESLEQVSESEFVSLVVVKVGPIKAKFNGKVSLTDIVAPASYRLIGEGQGGVAGFAKSEITVELIERGPECTTIKYGVTAHIGGKIAQLGSRLIDSTARKMAEQFFSKFNARVCPNIEDQNGSQASIGVMSGALNEELGTLRCGDQILVTMVDVTEDPEHAQTQQRRSGSGQIKNTHGATEMWSIAQRSVKQFYQRIAHQVTGASESANKNASQGTAQGTAHSPSNTKSGTDNLSLSSPRHQAAVVTINRVAQRNAVSLAMWQELGRIFTVLGQRPEVRAIILTGAGAHFSAGADIAEFSKVRATIEQGVEYEESVDACCDAIAATPKPTIAVVNGFCMGGACHLAMSCDFRYANTDAQFAIPAARLSIVYGVRGVQRLLALVGVSQAKHILYSAERFDAQQGLQMGFLDAVAPEPMRAARSYAGVMADNAPLTITGSKILLNGLTMDLGILTNAIVDQVVNDAVGSADYRDARQAFVEKRRPIFVGK